MLSLNLLQIPHVQTLTPGSFDFFLQMVRLQQAFGTFYLGKHSGRRLHWQSTLGHCVLKANFNKVKCLGSVQALVSFFINLVQSSCHCRCLERKSRSNHVQYQRCFVDQFWNFFTATLCGCVCSWLCLCVCSWLCLCVFVAVCVFVCVRGCVFVCCRARKSCRCPLFQSLVLMLFNSGDTFSFGEIQQATGIG